MAITHVCPHASKKTCTITSKLVTKTIWMTYVFFFFLVCLKTKREGGDCSSTLVCALFITSYISNNFEHAQYTTFFCGSKNRVTLNKNSWNNTNTHCQSHFSLSLSLLQIRWEIHIQSREQTRGERWSSRFRKSLPPSGSPQIVLLFLSENKKGKQNWNFKTTKTIYFFYVPCVRLYQDAQNPMVHHHNENNRLLHPHPKK